MVDGPSFYILLNFKFTTTSLVLQMLPEKFVLLESVHTDILEILKWEALPLHPHFDLSIGSYELSSLSVRRSDIEPVQNRVATPVNNSVMPLRMLTEVRAGTIAPTWSLFSLAERQGMPGDTNLLVHLQKLRQILQMNLWASWGIDS